MIQVNNQAINWNNISNWTDNNNVITTAQNTPVSIIQSDVFQLDIHSSPNDFFLFFKVDGHIPNFSFLDIDVIIQNIGTVTWKIKKKNFNSNNTRAFRYEKLKLKKIWFNNAVQSVSLKFTFQNVGNTNVAISNVSIDTTAIQPAAASNRNGTGTSGPNGPR